MCEDFGNKHCLLDKLFFMLNSKRGTFSEENLDQCIECTQYTLEKWAQMKFSITHRKHILLAH